jgi:hypothetical protein
MNASNPTPVSSPLLGTELVFNTIIMILQSEFAS